MISGSAILSFQRDGYVVVRDAFSAEDIDRLRNAIVTAGREATRLGRVLPSKTGEVVPVGDLLGMPVLRDLVFDTRLVEIARALIGRRDVVYFGDSGVMIGGQLRGFHKDNTNRTDPDHPDWRSPYTLLRFGLYLQDHARYSGGLKVRRGSHLVADTTTGEIVDIDTRPGDLVVWNLRTTHSGHAVRARGMQSLRLQPRFEARTPSWFRVPEPCQRLAAFITYGTNDGHMRAYVARHENLAEYPNNYMYKSWLYSDPADWATPIAESQGCNFIRPTAVYGSLHSERSRPPSGYIDVSPAAADREPEPLGTERWIRGAGRLLRLFGGIRS